MDASAETPIYSLRPATQDDYDFLWWLHRASMQPYVEQTWGWDEEWQAEYFRRQFDPATRTIVEVGGGPAGLLSVERHADRIFLAAIEIAPGYQNRGIGTALLRDLCREADRTLLPVELGVLKVNPAQRLYQRLGFSVVEESATHLHMRRAPGTSG